MSRFFLNNAYYFITVPTIKHVKFFNTPKKKELVLEGIIEAERKFNLPRFDYGININHYHLLNYFKNSQLIPKVLNYINGGSSFKLNKIDNYKGRSIWDEYYIYYINNEDLLYKVKGYVIGNPYKHHEVNNLKELGDYDYSSFKRVSDRIGIKEAEQMVLSVIGVNEADFERQFRNINLPKGS